VITKGIAAVAVSGDVLVESIVFAGLDIDSRRPRKIGTDPDKPEYQCEESYTLRVH